MNNDQFFGWWNGDDLTPDNDFPKDSPIWWAWEGWQAGRKAEREACAQVCDSYDVAEDVCSSDTAEGIAIAIRARRNHD